MPTFFYSYAPDLENRKESDEEDGEILADDMKTAITILREKYNLMGDDVVVEPVLKSNGFDFDGLTANDILTALILQTQSIWKESTNTLLLVSLRDSLMIMHDSNEAVQ